ncbi:hypothetical protein RHMOL_Rhmol06G0038500 [Rhododendron molle]|uniref:Uncharacterized protein n=2 Tax=Rhododendron molle TaxID=49168 RepID=A0ACC0N8P1_RHOML|nr:hypothetical protein RHMOL_Rhmol06G0038500 [Rhododendron molle]KAI8549611.1 hypothetical protein RHMOL_Rhmol06G0038500 [Rhododendron molle]
MESANLHHHHHHHQLQVQDQLVIGSSPLSTSNPCFFGVGVGNTTHSWAPNTLLSPSSQFSSSIVNGSVILNSRDISRQQNDFLAPSLNSSSMIQDMGFQWARSNTNSNTNGELSYPYHQKFTEMVINHSSPSPSSSSHTQDFQLQQPPAIGYTKNEDRELREMSEKLLLRNFSPGLQIKGLQFQAGNSSRGSFSQILPTIDISNLNRSNSNSGISSSLDMNMQPLELFTNSDCRFSAGCLSPASNDIHGFYKDNLYYGVDDHMQQSRPSNSTSKISAFTSGVSEAKRPSSFMEPKVTHSAQKKSRSDSRSSCPPIKTDTASVLMEAIGYIKFLQNQVETLSVPYMKPPRNRSSRTIRGGSSEDGNEESKPDLRSRGLCLVPLTCLSYVTDGGGGVWPPPNFG